MALRCVPLMKNCARCSSLIFASGAGAGPSTRPCGWCTPHALDEVARVVHRAVERRPADDDVDERDDRRIAHRLAGTRISRSKNAS